MSSADTASDTVGERPCLAVGPHPAAVDESAQLVRVQGATGGGRAVDDVQQSPVAPGRSFVGESRGEGVGEESVDGREPEAAGASGGVRSVVCGGVHDDPSWSERPERRMSSDMYMSLRMYMKCDMDPERMSSCM